MSYIWEITQQLKVKFLKFAACACFMPMGVQRNVYKEASPKGPPIWINFFSWVGERLLLPSMLASMPSPKQVIMHSFTSGIQK